MHFVSWKITFSQCLQHFTANSARGADNGYSISHFILVHRGG
jgi:hypothetical protein